MSRKKIISAVLLLVVCAIWGKIVWDVVNFSSDSDDSYSQIQLAPTLDSIPSIEPYWPSESYRDPFLGIHKTNPRKKHHTPKVKVQKEPSPKQISIWPNIRYLGSVKNAKKGKSLAILRINGQEMILAEGESVEQLTVKLVHNDSVMLALGDESRSFSK